MKRNSKKGVTLVFVVLMMAVLSIFSIALLTSASYNQNMAGRNQQGRQAYLSAKSAVEYAKLYVDRNIAALNAEPKPCVFYIICNGDTPDDGFVRQALAPVDSKIYAEVRLEATGITIKGRAPYLDSNQKTLGYKSTVLVVPPKYVPLSLSYVVCGNQFVNMNDFSIIKIFKEFDLSATYQEFVTTATDGIIGTNTEEITYPVIVTKTLWQSAAANMKQLTVPKLFLMGDSMGGYSFQSEDGAKDLTFISNFFCIMNDINSKGGSALYLKPKTGSQGYVCFDKDVRITNGHFGTTQIISKGYYKFTGSVNLFDLGVRTKLIALTPEEMSSDLIKESQSQVDFLHGSAVDMVSGERVGWTSMDNILQPNPSPQDGKIVYLASKNSSPSGYTYKAEQILYHYRTTTQTMDITARTEFDTRYLWFKYDYRNKNIQKSGNGKLLLTDCECVYFNDDIKIIYDSISWPNKTYIIGNGAYKKKDSSLVDTVDLLANPNGADGFFTNYERDPNFGQGPGQMVSSGSITVSGGEYTDGT